jgi:hypothetical protein
VAEWTYNGTPALICAAKWCKSQTAALLQNLSSAMPAQTLVISITTMSVTCTSNNKCHKWQLHYDNKQMMESRLFGQSQVSNHSMLASEMQFLEFILNVLLGAKVALTII